MLRKQPLDRHPQLFVVVGTVLTAVLVSDSPVVTLYMSVEDVSVLSCYRMEC